MRSVQLERRTRSLTHGQHDVGLQLPFQPQNPITGKSFVKTLLLTIICTPFSSPFVKLRLTSFFIKEFYDDDDGTKL